MARKGGSFATIVPRELRPFLRSNLTRGEKERLKIALAEYNGRVIEAWKDLMKMLEGKP